MVVYSQTGASPATEGLKLVINMDSRSLSVKGYQPTKKAVVKLIDYSLLIIFFITFSHNSLL